jgi:hypothetical protein
MSAVLFLALAASAPAVAPPPKADPAALVRQLGSERYAARAEAERRLLALGERSIQAVEAGRRHADLEVRRRCQALLTRLRVALCASRLKALRAGRADSAVPLWEHYRRLLGSGPEARALFAEMYESECDLLEEVALSLRRRDHKAASNLYREQVRALHARFLPRKVPEKGDKQHLPADFVHRLCAALLIGTLPGVELDDAARAALGGELLTYNVALRRAAPRKDQRGRLLRELLGRWCLAARGEKALLWSLRVALLYELAEPARGVARRAVARAKGPVLLVTAAYALGRYGRPRDVRLLLPLLRNEEESYRAVPGPPVVPEVADLALQALVRLTGQKESEYGVETSALMGQTYLDNAQGKRVLEVVHCPVGCFDEAPEREAAFRKWREWAEKHPERLGLPRVKKPAAAVKFEPRRAHAEARDAALAGVAHGRRYRNWARDAEAVKITALLKLTVGEDRVTVADFWGKDLVRDQGRWWAVAMPVVGRGLVRARADSGGQVSLHLSGVAFDDAAGTVARTTIDYRGGALSLDLERRELQSTLRLRFEQRDRLTLVIRRVRHRDGKPLYEARRSVDSLARLREDHPEDHALLLGLLRQTGAVAPAGKR